MTTSQTKSGRIFVPVASLQLSLKRWRLLLPRPCNPLPVAEAPHVPAGLDLKKLHDFKSDIHPLTRSIADIKATARRAVVAPASAPA